jgi:hypothetical protein
MKFKTPSGKSAKENATLIGGAAVGGALSKAVFGLLHEKKAVTDADKKSEATMSHAKRAGIIAAAGFGAAAITTTDTISTLAKGALAGMAVVQTLELVKDLAAKNATVASMTAGTTAKDKFVARALGLGCSCDNENQYPALAKPRYARLRMPSYDEAEDDQPETPTYQLNAFEESVNAGSVLAAS